MPRRQPKCPISLLRNGMNAGHYRDLMLRAMASNNDEMIDSIAAHLADCERGKELLRIKGYGLTGTSLEFMARMVPGVGD